MTGENHPLDFLKTRNPNGGITPPSSSQTFGLGGDWSLDVALRF
jgi:hypothetical protein